MFNIFETIYNMLKRLDEVEEKYHKIIIMILLIFIIVHLHS